MTLRAIVVAAGLLLVGGCAREVRPFAPDPAEVAVRVRELRMDALLEAPVVVLEEIGGKRELPIVIGMAEAESIAWKLQDEKPPRPNGHDLTKRLLDRTGGVVERVAVTELHDGVYFARIWLVEDGQRHSIDARPSDAIALGLRVGAPLFAHETLLMEPEETPLAPPDEGPSPFESEPRDDRQVESRSL